jgi:hypothetical protein
MNSTAPTGKRFLTGPRGVAAMFAMGFTATGLLYAYWTLHLMPFMPLQEAIVKEFPGSAPRVDGGQNKMHKETPKVIRIAMKLPYDPRSTDPEDIEKLNTTKNRVRQLVEEKVQDSEFRFRQLSYVELYVYHLVQEKEIRERTFRHESKSDSTWVEFTRDGKPVEVKPSDASDSSSSTSPPTSPAP